MTDTRRFVNLRVESTPWAPGGPVTYDIMGTCTCCGYDVGDEELPAGSTREDAEAALERMQKEEAIR